MSLMFDLMRINEAYENMQKSQQPLNATKPENSSIDSDDYIEPKLNATKGVSMQNAFVNPTPAQSVVNSVNSLRKNLTGFGKTSPSSTLRAISTNVKNRLVRNSDSLDSLYASPGKVDGEYAQRIATGIELSGLSDPENAMKMQQDIDAKRYGEVVTRGTEDMYNNMFNKDGKGVPWSAVTNSPAAHYPFEQLRQGNYPSPVSIARAFDAAANNIDKYNAARQSQPKPTTPSLSVNR